MYLYLFDRRFYLKQLTMPLGYTFFQYAKQTPDWACQIILFTVIVDKIFCGNDIIMISDFIFE